MVTNTYNTRANPKITSLFGIALHNPPYQSYAPNITNGSIIYEITQDSSYCKVAHNIRWNGSIASQSVDILSPSVAIPEFIRKNNSSTFGYKLDTENGILYPTVNFENNNVNVIGYTFIEGAYAINPRSFDSVTSNNRYFGNSNFFNFGGASAHGGWGVTTIKAMEDGIAQYNAPKNYSGILFVGRSNACEMHPFIVYNDNLYFSNSDTITAKYDSTTNNVTFTTTTAHPMNVELFF